MKPSTFPVLDIGDYILREWRLDDAADAFAFRSDPHADRFWRNAPPDVEEMRDWIEGYISRFYRQTGLYWAIADKDNDRVIGMCHFVNWDHNHCRVGVGYFLAKSHWNQGITTLALKAIVNYGFSHMGLNRIQASTAVGNRASQRVLEKVGFQCEGRLREYILRHSEFSDSLMYSLLKKEWRK